MNREITRLAHWVMISDCFEYDSKEVLRLLYKFKSVESLFEYLKWKIKPLVSNRKLVNYLGSKHQLDILIYEKEIRNMINKGIKILPYVDEAYPEMLRKIPDPPVVLYVKGKLSNFDNCIAIVGTRNLSHFGHKMARMISQEMARHGYTIVSGLARGTDTEAHCGALDVGGKTIAILPSRIDQIYPKENENLARDIAKNGALISETSPFQVLEKRRFPMRNRIISGISHSLIVIETSSWGGAIIQARIAISQGKKVFVLTPPQENRTAMEGFKRLLAEGAIQFKEAQEILEDIGA